MQFFGKVALSFHIRYNKIMADTGKKKYTAEELSTMDPAVMAGIILSLQDQIEALNTSFENLIEQIRIANQNRFGRRTEKLDVIDGQLSLFDEAENLADSDTAEACVEEVVQAYKRRKKKGKREEDLSGFPEEPHEHKVSEEDLDAFFGKGNWKAMPSDEYKRLRYEPASWTVEKHTVEVYVGTDGIHQDEFMRGDRPKDLIRNSIVTPSLGAAILNGKYVNAIPLYRIEQEFDRNGLTLSRQTMANWVIGFDNYFEPLWQRMKYHLKLLHVTQADETPVLVLNNGEPERSKCYMWVYRSGEYYTERQVILYEYQPSRDHRYPSEFLKDYKGILVTDGLQQYHLVEKEIAGLINANCWAHARRDFADACKAIGKKNQSALRLSVAHKALELIAAIYHEDEKLKAETAEERLAQRRIKVAPHVESFFAWAKERLNDGSSLPKGKTVEGLNYCINQEKYLRVFLTDGNVPIDNSASERAIRPFCIGKKNWILINSEKGARASARAYSIAETAKANNLKPYKYFEYLLTELPQRVYEDGSINPAELDDLMPWSDSIPDDCKKSR